MKGDAEPKPRPSSVRRRADGAGWAWGLCLLGQAMNGKARVLVPGPGSALPYCVNLDSTLSFLSLEALPTPIRRLQ